MGGWEGPVIKYEDGGIQYGKIIGLKISAPCSPLETGLNILWTFSLAQLHSSMAKT